MEKEKDTKEKVANRQANKVKIAIESEYQVAWNQGFNEENWEHSDYDYYPYDVGYNYTLTQDNQWQTVGKHYSMMMIVNEKPPPVTGPKFFIANMHNEEDANEDEWESTGVEEPNSKCKCTEIKWYHIAKSKNKNKAGVKQTKNKKAANDDHNDNSNDNNSITTTTTQHDNNTTTRQRTEHINITTTTIIAGYSTQHGNVEEDDDEEMYNVASMNLIN